MSTGNDDDDDKDSWRISYDGTRGPKWRAFRRDFMQKARGRYAKDDRFSFKTAYLKLDEGGTAPGAPALPGGAPLAACQAKRERRLGQAYTFLYECISDDRLKDMLADIPDNHADGAAGAAWDLIVRECDDLLMNWNSLD